MRVLVVGHGPLQAKGGAAQAALSLAEGLRGRGHDAVAWSPDPVPGARWHDLWLRQRRRLEAYVESEPTFDVIDAPAISISRRVAAAAGTIVARSVQPELRYLAAGLREQLRPGSPHRLRVPVHALHGLVLAAAVARGWSRAHRVLTLGTHELDWMRARVPWTRPKLRSYVVAPPPEERPLLAAVLARRRAPAEDRGIRFLWVGRWVDQKGARRLVSWAAARLAREGRDSLTIAGCGPDAESDLPPGLLAAGRIRTIPSFSREELPAILEAHDAGLFTSPVEGWGLSLNEMLESGLPVFATEAGGVRDLRPYFPDALHPFPPPPDLRAPDLRPAQVPAAYLRRFDWGAIAETWERAVLGAPAAEAGRIHA